eukprot:TRINITY_DN20915_c0_g1_i2.p2 TRINITY_DN20915_c0_g1~~TRINITY_DN20915_c0_g1_i2.p2  ORF type:complete len:112 (-),score=21.60 TRINITY_DN20915_c0_g1_i2:23-322(-)
MDAATFQQLFADAGSKKKEVASAAKQTLEGTSTGARLPRDVLDVALASLQKTNTPGTIAASCDFLAMFVKATDMQDVYYLMIPAVAVMCLDFKKSVQES